MMLRCTSFKKWHQNHPNFGWLRPRCIAATRTPAWAAGGGGEGGLRSTETLLKSPFSSNMWSSARRSARRRRVGGRTGAEAQSVLGALPACLQPFQQAPAGLGGGEGSFLSSAVLPLSRGFRNPPRRAPRRCWLMNPCRGSQGGRSGGRHRCLAAQQGLGSKPWVRTAVLHRGCPNWAVSHPKNTPLRKARSNPARYWLPGEREPFSRRGEAAGKYLLPWHGRSLFIKPRLTKATK